jgi:hypothetical protein
MKNSGYYLLAVKLQPSYPSPPYSTSVTAAAPSNQIWLPADSSVITTIL